jgi:pimeloyl-ACP methyl ester carboxylesterase
MKRVRALVLAAAIAAGVCASSLAQNAMPTRPVWQRVELAHAADRYAFAVYANMPFGQDLPEVDTAIIILHGLQRNGNDYYAAGVKLLAESLARQTATLVLAPNFFAVADAGTPGIDGMPLWTVQGWIVGEDAVNGKFALSSLDVLDDLVASLADGKRLPALKRIVIAGHSGGAQFAQRYAVLSASDERIRALGIELRYVVANPSSYLYFDNLRPHGDAFAPYNTTWCPNYNDYRYGLDHTVRYAGQASGRDLFRRYAARNVTYLLGSLDVDPRHPSLDKQCGAEAEGANRNERGRGYLKHLMHLAGTSRLNHRAFEVQGVGHDQEKMFGSTCGVEALFDRRANAATAAACVPFDMH